MKKIAVFSTILIAWTITANAQWTQQTSGTTNNLWGVSFVDQNLGFVCGDTGTILKTINGGINWVPQNSGVICQLAVLQFIDANTGYCAGWAEDGGKLLKTGNGGTTWNDISLNIPNVRSGGMWFFSADTGLMAFGDNSYANSKILKTVNGGVSWDTVYDGGTGWISFFHFPDRLNGYATVSGSRILKTANGGNNWTLLDNLGGNLWMSGIYFFNKDTGLVGGGDFNTGGGSIFKTTNGGDTWQTQTDEYGTSIMLFTAPDVGYAIGSNTNWSVKKIIKTADGGTIWACDTTPVYKLNGIAFPTAYIGYAIGDGGTILKTTISGTGVRKNIAEERFNIYPNPASDNITLNINNGKNENVELYIYTVMGRLVKSVTLKQNQQQINIGNLSSGIYMIKIRSGEWSEKHKLIIQR